MNTIGKIQNKGQVTIPTSVRRLAGLSKGDLVDFAFLRGKIVITPKLVIDRSRFPAAGDEYTPTQRRAIDARLTKADGDIKHGRIYGPFNTAEEMAASIEANINKLRATKKKAKPAR